MRRLKTFEQRLERLLARYPDGFRPRLRIRTIFEDAEGLPERISLSDGKKVLLDLGPAELSGGCDMPGPEPGDGLRWLTIRVRETRGAVVQKSGKAVLQISAKAIPRASAGGNGNAAGDLAEDEAQRLLDEIERLEKRKRALLEGKRKC